MLFSCQRPGFTGQGFILEGLELRGDEALCVFEGLATHVGFGRGGSLGFRYFDVVAVNAVVANFQATKSCRLSLSLLYLE